MKDLFEEPVFAFAHVEGIFTRCSGGKISGGGSGSESGGSEGGEPSAVCEGFVCEPLTTIVEHADETHVIE